MTTLHRPLTLALLAALTFACAGAPPVPPRAASAPTPPATLADPARALAEMEFFVGTWTCTGESDKTHLWDAHPSTTTMKVAHDLDGTWLKIEAAEDAAGQGKPLRVSGFWGLDATTASLVRTFATNYGGWGFGRSRGWTGDTLVWEGELHQGNAQLLAFRHTIVRQGDGFSERFEVRDGTGAWIRRGGSSCRR